MRIHRAPALLDCGSQSSFMTEKLFNRLNLDAQKTSLAVKGISNSLSRVSHKCDAEIHSSCSSFRARLTCFILPEIINATPIYKINVGSLAIPYEITLANPKFFKPGSIDLLVGADLFWELIGSSRISCGKNKPN